jgi:hypothetical protein
MQTANALGIFGACAKPTPSAWNRTKVHNEGTQQHREHIGSQIQTSDGLADGNFSQPTKFTITCRRPSYTTGEFLCTEFLHAVAVGETVATPDLNGFVHISSESRNSLDWITVANARTVELQLWRRAWRMQPNFE